MKLSDVKVGMRVAVVDFENELTHFGTVKLIGDHRAFVDHSWYAPVFLRKVKPKKSVSFEADIYNAFSDGGYRGGLATSELKEFIGKRVLVTVKEIKS